MQDLSATYNPALTPTSQEGGNMIQPDLAKAAMTAPGSDPVSPLPGPNSGSDPRINISDNVPLSDAPHKPTPARGNTGGGSWARPGSSGSLWKQNP